MSKYACELFGVLHYGPELSYYELYACEERLIVQLQELLEAMSAQHLDFWGTGDALQFQCALPDFEPDAVRAFCDEAVALLDSNLQGRVLCLNKQLSDVYVLHLAPGRWEECHYPIAPATDPEATDWPERPAGPDGETRPGRPRRTKGTSGKTRAAKASEPADTPSFDAEGADSAEAAVPDEEA